MPRAIRHELATLPGAPSTRLLLPALHHCLRGPKHPIVKRHNTMRTQAAFGVEEWPSGMEVAT